MASHLLWLAGAYVAGTFPSTLLAARIRGGAGGRALLTEARREAGEADPHILMTRHLGPAWSTASMVVDVVKGFVYLLVARGAGGLPNGWLAACGIAIVLGHAFPFYAARMAGRGLAAASGVYLALLPWQMVLAGILILIGLRMKNSGIATTLGMASVPAAAVWQGQPDAYVTMAVIMFGVLMARRLEGVGEVIRSGVPASRAVLFRCLFDASAHPRPDEVPGRGEVTPPSGR
jgi:acyl phosphate:glycerol-3-phosphate acyltransferase